MEDLYKDLNKLAKNISSARSSINYTKQKLSAVGLEILDVSDAFNSIINAKTNLDIIAKKCGYFKDEN